MVLVLVTVVLNALAEALLFEPVEELAKFDNELFIGISISCPATVVLPTMLMIRVVFDWLPAITGVVVVLTASSVTTSGEIIELLLLLGIGIDAFSLADAFCRGGLVVVVVDSTLTVVRVVVVVLVVVPVSGGSSPPPALPFPVLFTAVGLGVVDGIDMFSSIGRSRMMFVLFGNVSSRTIDDAFTVAVTFGGMRTRVTLSFSALTEGTVERVSCVSSTFAGALPSPSSFSADCPLIVNRMVMRSKQTSCL